MEHLFGKGFHAKRKDVSFSLGHIEKHKDKISCMVSVSDLRSW